VTVRTPTLSNRIVALSFAFPAFVSTLLSKGFQRGWGTLLDPRAWVGPLLAGVVLFLLTYGILAAVSSIIAPSPRAKGEPDAN
jgi:hypothetical protein